MGNTKTVKKSPPFVFLKFESDATSLVAGNVDGTLLQEIKIIKRLTRADCYAGYRIFCNAGPDSRHLLNKLVKAVKQATATRHHNAVM